MIAHPFRDGGSHVSGVYGLLYPLLLLVSLVFIFAFEKFEFGIFVGFCICFLLDNFMSRRLIKKTATCLPLDIGVLALSLRPEVVRSQVFRNSLFTAWQVVLLCKTPTDEDCHALKRVRQDIKEIVFYESDSLQGAYSKALALSRVFGVSTEFQDGNGEKPEFSLKGNDLEEYKDLRRKCRQVIKDSEIAACRNLIVVKHKVVPYTLESHWNCKSYIHMGHEIFAILVKSFVLVIAINCLSFTGELVWGFFLPNPMQNMRQSIQASLLVVNYERFILDNFVDFFEVLIISGFLLSKSLDISMSEIFRINQEKLSYSLRFRFLGGERYQGSLAVHEVEDILFIRNPCPTIIVADSKNIIEITGLQKIAEFKVLLLRLAEAIGSVRYKSRYAKS